MNRTELFDNLREHSPLGPTLDQGEVDGVNIIVDAMHGLPVSWTAYALATAYHETAGTMKPIKERGSDAYFTRMYDVTGASPDRARKHGNTLPGDGKLYCGRGYVQLTWADNYQKVGKLIDIDLVSRPDNAMDPMIAAEIMANGMKNGWFTGKSFKDFLPNGIGTREEFKRARAIINGSDRADDIADYALLFQSALTAAEWGKKETLHTI